MLGDERSHKKDKGGLERRGRFSAVFAMAGARGNDILNLGFECDRHVHSEGFKEYCNWKPDRVNGQH